MSCDEIREIHSDKTHQRQYVFILCYKPCSCISIREIIRWWDTVVRSRPSNCDEWMATHRRQSLRYELWWEVHSYARWCILWEWMATHRRQSLRYELWSQHDIVEKLLTWELKIITHSLIMEWPLYRRDQISPAHIVFKLSTFINDFSIVFCTFSLILMWFCQKLQ
jgi:hypothetical protein